MHKNKARLQVKIAQQETVGFVLIIIIVMILGVIFLGISLRNKEKPVFVEDAELGNFLSSTLKYTTECYGEQDSDLKNLKELAYYCYSQKPLNCPDYKTSCKVLEENYESMLNVYKPAGLTQYAIVSFNYNDSITHLQFLNVTLGNQTLCSTRRAAREDIDSGSGRITLEMEVCLKQVS